MLVIKNATFWRFKCQKCFMTFVLQNWHLNIRIWHFKCRRLAFMKLTLCTSPTWAWNVVTPPPLMVIPIMPGNQGSKVYLGIGHASTSISCSFLTLDLVNVVDSLTHLWQRTSTWLLQRILTGNNTLERKKIFYWSLNSTKWGMLFTKKRKTLFVDRNKLVGTKNRI